MAPFADVTGRTTGVLHPHFTEDHPSTPGADRVLIRDAVSSMVTFDAFWSALTALIVGIAINATNKAYSTRVVPRSLRRRGRPRPGRRGSLGVVDAQRSARSEPSMDSEPSIPDPTGSPEASMWLGSACRTAYPIGQKTYWLRNVSRSAAGPGATSAAPTAFRPVDSVRPRHRIRSRQRSYRPLRR